MVCNGQDRILVIACGAIALELVRVQKANEWHHLDFQCLPPELHNHPDQLPAAVEAKIKAAAGSYRKIFIAFADCGTSGRLDAVLDRYGIERIPGAHCYEFLAGSEVFEALATAEPGSFYLTDFLARHFERIVIRPLRLDTNPELRDSYFGNYRRLVYLSQQQDDALLGAARQAAERLGLDFEHIHCGFGELESGLANFVAAASDG